MFSIFSFLFYLLFPLFLSSLPTNRSLVFYFLAVQSSISFILSSVELRFSFLRLGSVSLFFGAFLKLFFLSLLTSLTVLLLCFLLFPFSSVFHFVFIWIRLKQTISTTTVLSKVYEWSTTPYVPVRPHCNLTMRKETNTQSIVTKFVYSLLHLISCRLKERNKVLKKCQLL